ncbi:NAD(P)-dependent oxidoreductase [Anaerobacillus alkalidiazotrophicus]|uniref:NAD(P)-dependent oxidoreductase n=1 Tax=Anaerobacillus alkalidiazotrophicus TaxID=472963 RepID=A0A1S2M9K0_9BACI|nr:SDR family oxidoreductase [Anaerobacillus alkalidiazotrophicus]OIJ21391.1 NAD(P)-dependent oxidoreductase [Anaerobacillus alkalidiazotrophicus]
MEIQLPTAFPPQHQTKQPGIETEMKPRPIFDDPSYKGSGKLTGKVALITGGDSGIGRAVAIAFAKEGANVAIAYLDETVDAEETKELVEAKGVQCLLLPGNIEEEAVCKKIVADTVSHFGKLDILINNAAWQIVQNNIKNITTEQLEKTFRVNIFSVFHFVKAALSHLKQGSSIINTTSVTAYHGHEQLIDYSSTKGAMVTFTRSLSMQLATLGIRVNGVAPGPIWTPLIPSSFLASQVANFGSNTPMKRAGQPFELAPTYVYLASNDSSYVSGQIIHVNGGEIVNG